MDVNRFKFVVLIFLEIYFVWVVVSILVLVVMSVWYENFLDWVEYFKRLRVYVMLVILINDYIVVLVLLFLFIDVYVDYVIDGY